MHRCGAAAQEACDRAAAAARRGDPQAALRYYEYARRLAPTESEIVLSIAAMRLGQHDPCAAEAFELIARRDDVQEAWLGLAVSRHRQGLHDLAVQALRELLSRHGYVRGSVNLGLQDVIALGHGEAGWCGLSADGKLQVTLLHATADMNRIVILLDESPIAAEPSRRSHEGNSQRAVYLLPKSWQEVRRIGVCLEGRHLCGSPLDAARIGQMEGFVSAQDGGLMGWAWFSHDPDCAPALTVRGANGAMQRTVASDPCWSNCTISSVTIRHCSRWQMRSTRPTMLWCMTTWICPRITLIGPERRYCGEPDADTCEACYADIGGDIEYDINPSQLRLRSASLLDGARQVVVSSQDVARRLQRYFPGLVCKVKPWETDAALPPPPKSRSGRRRRRIAIVGAIGIEKGYEYLLACARHVAARNLGLEFVVIGHTCDDKRLLDTGAVYITGPYDEAEAVALIRSQQAELGFLPSLWPETWSYTLSQMWQAGLDVVAFDLGAPAERIRATGRGTLLPLGMPPASACRTVLAYKAGFEAEAGGMASTAVA